MTEINEAANAQDNTNAAADTGNESNENKENQTTEGQPVDFSSFKNGLPDDLKSNVSHETFEDFVKDYSDLKGKVPEVPESYQIAYANEDYKGTVSPDQEQAFFSAAKNMGLTQKQVESLIAFDEQRFSTQVNAINEAQQKARDDSENLLREQWKGDYDKNVDIANAAFKHYLDATGTKKNDVSEGIRNDPNVIKMFKYWGDAIGEDAFQEGMSVKSKTPKDNYGNPMLFDPKNKG